MSDHKTQPTVAFDVDGTLIHQAGDLCDTPRYKVIELLRHLHTLRCHIYVWSGGGVDYAEHWVQKLGLAGMVAVVAKGSFVPDIAVDDMAHESEFNLGKVNIAV